VRRGPATAQTKIKIADSFPVGHYLPKYFTTPMMERLKADPAAKGIEFEYYPAEQLGKAKDLLSLTQSGLVDIAYVGPGFVSDKMPLSVVPELPASWLVSGDDGLLESGQARRAARQEGVRAQRRAPAVHHRAAALPGHHAQAFASLSDLMA
jgi:hypothetical protein